MNVACQNIVRLESVVHYSAELQLAQQYKSTSDYSHDIFILLVILFMITNIH